jgi:hypothetical protein
VWRAVDYRLPILRETVGAGNGKLGGGSGILNCWVFWRLLYVCVSSGCEGCACRAVEPVHASRSLDFPSAHCLRRRWGGSTTPVTPTITSVAVVCSPSSINTNQTSTCTPTVSGTGNYSSSVTWSVSPTSIGTVSSAGVFTASRYGDGDHHRNIDAGFDQIRQCNGDSDRAVHNHFGFGGCSPASILTTQTSTCTATVQGTGSYSSAVTWGATDGTITSSGVFTPTGTGTATITATSTQDTTKSGTASIVVGSQTN